MSTHSWTHVVENCSFKNIDVACASLEMGTGVNLVTHHRHNTAQGGFIFFSDGSANWANTNDASTIVATHTITKNRWVGAPGSVAVIALRPNVFEPRYSHGQWKCAPYNNLTITITDNCFEVPGATIPGVLPAAFGAFLKGVSGCDAGNATIHADHNNFIGFETSLNELSLSPESCKPPRGPLNINYLFGANYWGSPAVPPALTDPGYAGTIVPGIASEQPFPCSQIGACE
jgi:hypothetical protein